MKGMPSSCTRRHRNGAFNLRKFHTNCCELQRQIDAQENKVEVSFADEQSTTMEDLSYAKDMLGNYHYNKNGVKVIGVQWDNSSDQLVFNIQDICNTAEVVDPTKRNVIGIVSRFYDLLGVLAPLTICFKIFFQKVCVKGVDWDQPLTGELLLEWKGLVTTLKRFQTITIPRCYFAVGEEESISCNLVGFCDASCQAYAAVVYFRVQMASGCYTRFATAKTRAAPLQVQTIPRLELLGALLLSRLLTSVTSALSSEPTLNPPICFTDSKVYIILDPGM